MILGGSTAIADTKERRAPAETTSSVRVVLLTGRSAMSS